MFVFVFMLSFAHMYLGIIHICCIDGQICVYTRKLYLCGYIYTEMYGCMESLGTALSGETSRKEMDLKASGSRASIEDLTPLV